MLKLYHYYLCPSSRFIRLILDECKIKYALQLENYWDPQKVFLQINPAGHLPVLINESGYPIIGANACIEYFKDLNFKPSLFGSGYMDKAEINRLYHWFDTLFKKEVLETIIYEKVFSIIVSNITPNSNNIRNALQNLHFHIQYLDYLLSDNDYLIGESITCSDFIAAANFSVLDYLGLLHFGNNKNMREWYQKVKSRPSFKNLLKDQIVGLSPHENYKSIDI